jgi:hypothetical protein
MELFERLNSLEGLPNILNEIWHRCLNDQADKNEQRDIEEALESIKAGMIRLEKILTEGRKKSD